MASHAARAQTKEEKAEARRLAALYKRASNDFGDLLRSNNVHRVFTIKRDYMPNMFGALQPWSGKPEDMLGAVVKGDVMHFYQLMKYGNREDGHQTAVPALDVIGSICPLGDSPEGLYQDVIDAIRKVALAKQCKFLFKMDPEGIEELIPSEGQVWKPVVVTVDNDGDILFYELTDYVPQVQIMNATNKASTNAEEGNADTSGAKASPS